MVASTTCEPAPKSARAAAAPSRATGGTRWRRALFVLVPSLAILVFMAVSMMNGRLPIGVAMSRQSFSFSASALRSDEPILITTNPVATTAPAGNRIITANVVLDGVCLVLRRHVPGTSVSLAFAVHIPGNGTTATDLDMDAGHIDVGAARLQGSAAEPIVLGRPTWASATASGADTAFDTAGATSMQRLLVDSKSAFLAAMLNPAAGARVSLLTDGDGVCDS